MCMKNLHTHECMKEYYIIFYYVEEKQESWKKYFLKLHFTPKNTYVFQSMKKLKMISSKKIG